MANNVYWRLKDSMIIVEEETQIRHSKTGVGEHLTNVSILYQVVYVSWWRRFEMRSQSQ